MHLYCLEVVFKLKWLDASEHDPGCLAPCPGGNTISAMCRQVGSNELHLLFWVTNTLSIFKKCTFTSLLWATLLSLFYLNAIQIKKKCLHLFQTSRLLFSEQWAMPIREWFIILSHFSSKAWSKQLANQWFRPQIS